MKNITTLFLLVTTVILISCSTDKAPSPNVEEEIISIPEAIQTAFSDSYPSPKSANWEQVGDHYIVEVVEDVLETEIMYNKEGKIVSSEQEIYISTIPLAITDSINEKYANAEILEAEKVTTAAKVLFNISIEKNDEEYELVFDEKANLLSEGNDDDEDEDDDDED